MKIKIKAVRKGKAPDKLIDVIDIDGEQVAVILRSFKEIKEAQDFEDKVIEEDFDDQLIADFLAERKLIVEELEEQANYEKVNKDLNDDLQRLCNELIIIVQKYIPEMTRAEKLHLNRFKDKYKMKKQMKHK